MDKFTILFVDDEKNNLISFKASFREFYTIYTANSGKEAIELINNKQINLILSDQRMPDMTGIELFEIVKQKYPDIIRMIITGYSNMQTVIDAINKGNIYHYISKPWKHDELKLIIDKALFQYKLQKENKELIKQKRELELNAERKQREYISSQLKTLKDQINPHFLFNTLNSLYALIDVDSELSKRFILRLSKVYRYLLDFKDDDLTILEEELNFIDHYLFLQKIRFNDNINYQVDISEEFYQKQIPVNALLIIIENCIKHNKISNCEKLTIKVYVENNNLCISNNYNIREDAEESTGTGIENIKKRYSFISKKEPNFNIEGKEYIARLPLL